MNPFGVLLPGVAFLAPVLLCLLLVVLYWRRRALQAEDRAEALRSFAFMDALRGDCPIEGVYVAPENPPRGAPTADRCAPEWAVPRARPPRDPGAAA